MAGAAPARPESTILLLHVNDALGIEGVKSEREVDRVDGILSAVAVLRSTRTLPTSTPPATVLESRAEAWLASQVKRRSPTSRGALSRTRSRLHA
jgi:hypothetical protein